MDADKNEIAEKYSISLENDQELERKINDLNSRFGDKVIKYLGMMCSNLAEMIYLSQPIRV